jgi:hypothetical protein
MVVSVANTFAPAMNGIAITAAMMRLITYFMFLPFS